MTISGKKRFFLAVLTGCVLFLGACGRRDVVLEPVTESRTEKGGQTDTTSGGAETLPDAAVSESADADRRNAGEKSSGTPGDKSAQEDCDSAGEAGTAGTGSGTAKSSAGTTERLISVFVCGAVINPGVYSLPASSRAVDAVEYAGGFADDADREWCNLARLLSDGEKLVIYTAEQTQQLRDNGQRPEGEITAASAASGTSDAGSASGNTVNINACDQSALMTLPGIGETRANAIISYRNTHGNFSAPEDIMLVPGIKESIYSQIKDKITVG